MASSMDLTVGAITVSTWFSFLTMGVVSVVAWQYYKNFPKDPILIKSLVTVNVLVSIATTVGDATWCYAWAVTNWGVPTGLALLHWSAKMEIFFVGFTSLTVQCFYAWRVWTIASQKILWLPVLICILSLLQFSIVLWVVWYWTVHPTMLEVGGVMPIAFIWLGGSVGADVLITTSITWLLRSRSQGRVFSVKYINEIVSRTVQANILSLISQVMTFVFYEANLGLYFFIVDFTIIKVYTFSLLCSLNARRSHRGNFPRSEVRTDLGMSNVHTSGGVPSGRGHIAIDVSKTVENDSDDQFRDLRDWKVREHA